MESSPAYSTNGGYVRGMASIAGKSDQYPMRTLNSRYGSTRVWTVRKELAWCPATRFIPSLRLEGQAGESAAMRVISLTYRSNYQASMWRRTIDLLPSLARHHRVVVTPMRMNLSSAYDVRAENAVYVNLSTFRLNFPNADLSSEEWCYANVVSYGIIVLLF